MARVAVVGAGVGGLASAIRLAQRGHVVSVFEKNETVGGKLASQTIDGFTFDIGPSLLTMPQLFDELGVSFDRLQLTQPFGYAFADGSTLNVDSSPDSTALSFDSLAPGAGAQWRSLIERGKNIWAISERTFFAGPMTSPLSLIKRMQSPSDLIRIDSLRTLHSRASATFGDSRARQWLERYATYSGSSPFLAPATLACIPYLEQQFGCWHVPGGLALIVQAMEKRAIELGVSIRCNSEVERIQARSQVSGLR